jgi:hypothetical protein
MSISKSQAQALADGFVDTLGTDDKSDLQPRETLTELFLLAGECVEDAQDNLNHDNSNASGKLSSSLKLSQPEETGSIVSVDILMAYYGRFLNKGVKGTKSGAGVYAFKSEFPSKDMIKALVKGIDRAKRSTANVNRNKTVSSNEKKNVKISDIDKAYGAGRNIKRYGIKATGFMDKAVKNLSNKLSDRLGSALKIDIINSI